MELDTILDFLKNHGFKIIYSHFSSEYFGNIIVKIKLSNGYIVTIIRDRDIYECFIEIQKWIMQKSVPVIAVVKILKNESINTIDTTFNSTEEMLTYLIKHKQELDSIDDKTIKKVYKMWD